jgi:hypothetical protein
MMYAHRVYMAGRRSFKRWKCIIPVDYVINRKAYRDFIHDISANGVFIGCKERPSPGEKVVLTFAWKQQIKSNGTVVRTDSDGFAVRFTQPIAIQ